MVVVLPASMWATMPMLRTFDSSELIGWLLYHIAAQQTGAIPLAPRQIRRGDNAQTGFWDAPTQMSQVPSAEGGLRASLIRPV